MEWIRRSRSNLAKARADRNLPEVLYEDLCFDAEQAAEKSVKALLVFRKVPFPKTHDIVGLLTLLQKNGMDVPDEIRAAGILTEYAIDSRYPGLTEEVTEEDYTHALSLAERVVQWAESIIRYPGDEGKL
jgi:HEPN domain-containing protein